MQLITISPVLFSSGFPPAFSPFIFFIILVFLIAKSFFLAGVKFPNETPLHTHTHTHSNNTERAASSSQVRHQSVEVKSTREVTGRRFNLILHTTHVMALFFARRQHAFQPFDIPKAG